MGFLGKEATGRRLAVDTFEWTLVFFDFYRCFEFVTSMVLLPIRIWSFGEKAQAFYVVSKLGYALGFVAEKQFPES